MAKKRLEQRIPTHEEINDILKEVKRDEYELFEFSRFMFETIVDPEACHALQRDPDAEMQCDMAFTEWMLFDFEPEPGMSLIKRAARKNREFAEYAKTQFYSRFWVIEQHPKKGWSLLRDTFTNVDYRVYDDTIARRRKWRKGTLGIRIARVKGVWYAAGQLYLHDNAKSKPQPACKEKHKGPRNNPLAFIVNVEQVIGHTGSFRESAWIEELT